MSSSGNLPKYIVPNNLINSNNRNKESLTDRKKKIKDTLSVKGTSGNAFRTDVPDGSHTFVQPYTHVVFEQRIYLNVSNNDERERPRFLLLLFSFALNNS